MKCAWLWAALGAASWAGCGDPTIPPVFQLNLDRPVDVSFACYGRMRVLTDGHPPPGLPSDPITAATAQPTAACESLSPQLSGTQGPAPGQETLSDGIAIVPDWYAFILQSASGTVALARWPVKPADTIMPSRPGVASDFSVLDGDPLTPGKNAITIGEDPVAIATDKAGCFEVAANAGSCDLSELDINSALGNIVSGKVLAPVRIDRVPVTNKMGDMILARPAAMVAEPGSTAVGVACPATATGRVYIAYPSCHLVAGVDASTGKIVAGIRYDATGAPTILSGTDLDTVSCPAECTGGAGTVAGGPITPGPQPVALDLRLDTRVNSVKLAIGTKNSVSPMAGQAAPLTIVDLDAATSDPKSPALQIALEDPAVAAAGNTSALGITAVALSPQIGMGGYVLGDPVSDMSSPGGQGQYVYAIATDGTVRVADVLNRKRECDTQIDGRFLRSTTIPIADLQCLASGDAARPRRSGVRGPGIELPGHAVPTSVTIVKGRTAMPVDSNGNPLVATPTQPIGYIAVITASNGQAYVANVDDDNAPDGFATGTPLSNAPALVMAHQLRDGFTNREQGFLRSKVTDPVKMVTVQVPACQPPASMVTEPPASPDGFPTGGPRVSAEPSQNVPAGTINKDTALPLPTIQRVECLGGMADSDFKEGVRIPTSTSTLQITAPEPVRDLVFPDLRSVANEHWTLTWEGTLSLDNSTTAVDGPVIRSGLVAVDGRGMTLQDPAQPFCDMGVEPFDIVDLRGCNPANNDGDCPAGYTCYVHPKSQGIGVGECMLKSEAPRLADACFEFLTTLRRYTAGSTNTGALTLLERKHELAIAPIDGCVDDNQCDQLAQAALKIDQSLQATDPFTSRTHWACELDPLRAPINADPAKNKRCVQACSTDPAHPWDCASGTICRIDPNDKNATEGRCLEGVEPPQECVRGPQRYDVRASEAFTVIGSQSGYVHPIIKDPNSVACIRDPNVKGANNVQTGRIPLNVPACDPVATAATGQLPGGGFEANPCSVQVPQFDTNQQPDMPLCTDTRQVLPAPAVRNTQAIKFRNRAMTLTLVDPYQSCLPNKQGGLARVVLANRGYELDFPQTGGFSPLQLPGIQPTYPVKVVRGPSQSIWVIDDGDFLATSVLQASTRGTVFRIESANLNINNTLQ